MSPSSPISTIVLEIALWLWTGIPTLTAFLHHEPSVWVRGLLYNHLAIHFCAVLWISSFRGTISSVTIESDCKNILWAIHMGVEASIGMEVPVPLY
ncbi:hypothetical protein RJT34_26415 [Clitoria ternatea]|uniref:Uncharacterized protein n=1 Tax=Clitoria ternatea TaxID=43366 RepID=A0AAN9F964_CLITE